jgi:hypothetical protein
LRATTTDHEGKTCLEGRILEITPGYDRNKREC